MKIINRSLKLAERTIAASGLKNLLRPIYHAVQDVEYAHTLRRNSVLENAYRGKRCFILCTGASLHEIDIRLLNSEYTFGCNMLIQHPHLRPKTLSFFTSSDTLLGLQHSPQPLERPDALFPELERKFAGAETIFFFHASSKRFIERRGYLRDKKLFYLAADKPMHLATRQSIDLSRRMTFMDGSIFVMIASCIYMGFTELYLCGCGYTYQPRQSGHFYENWTKLDHEPVDEMHRISKSIADEHGVKIYNIVPEGFASPVYERIAWDRIVHDVLGAKDGYSEELAAEAICR